MSKLLLVIAITLTNVLCHSQTLSNDFVTVLNEQNKEHDVEERQHIYYESNNSVYRNGLWIELCTNDKDTAAYYSEKSARNSYYYRSIIDSAETNEYFEFFRENSKYDNYIFRSRIYKCSFFDPNSAKIIDKSKKLCGTFAQRPITINNFTKLVELLSNREKEITSFAINERSYEIEVVHHSIETTMFEGSNAIDNFGKGGYTQYELYQNSYTVDLLSGEVHLTRNLVKKSEKIY